MKHSMKYIALLLLFFTLFPNKIFAQKKNNENEECKVLSFYLSESYEGGCKKGLASGEGKAHGEDYYEGTFKKGLPDGMGKYVWANGAIYEGNWNYGTREGFGTYTFQYAGKDSVLTGYWRDDRYIGSENNPPYEVTLSREVNRYDFKKVDKEGNSIRIYFVRAVGTRNTDIRDLHADCSGANVNNIGPYLIIDKLEFPCTCTFTYTTPNALNTSTIYPQFTFKINDPGTWNVTISN